MHIVKHENFYTLDFLVSNIESEISFIIVVFSKIFKMEAQQRGHNSPSTLIIVTKDIQPSKLCYIKKKNLSLKTSSYLHITGLLILDH